MFLLFARQRGFFVGSKFCRPTTPKRGIPALQHTTSEVAQKAAFEEKRTFWRALAKGAAWAGPYCEILLLLLLLGKEEKRTLVDPQMRP